MERIHKFLSNLGYGSRREIEEWVNEGRLTVNGETATVGHRVGEDDAVKLDGKRISLKTGNEPLRVLMYKKRTGEMVTRDDPEGRRTVFRKLPELETGRWIAVGRLDVNTSGLLLLTNHGELARRLMHPSFEQKREYAVRALGEVPEDAFANLKKGVMLDDGEAHFDNIRFGEHEEEQADDDGEDDGELSQGRANHWFTVTISEGRHREVRRLFQSQNLIVNRLIRTAYGPIKLGRGIKSGSFREGSADEITRLLDAVGLPHTERLPERVRESHSNKAALEAAKAEANKGPEAQEFEGKNWQRVTGAAKFAGNKAPGSRAKPSSDSAGSEAPRQTKAKGFGASSTRSYAERGDAPRSSAKPEWQKRDAAAKPAWKGGDSDKPAWKPRDTSTTKPAWSKDSSADRPAWTKSEAKPAWKSEDSPSNPTWKAEGSPAKPRWTKRDDSAAEGSSSAPSRARPAYGEKPAYRADGERKPYAGREDGERKAYTPRAEGERPAFRAKPAWGKPDSGASEPSSFPRRERPAFGDRPAYRPEGERKSFTPRGDGERKPYASRDGGERKAYAPRAEGERPAFRARSEGVEGRSAAPRSSAWGDKPAGAERSAKPSYAARGGAGEGGPRDNRLGRGNNKPSYSAPIKPKARASAKPAGQKFTVKNGKATASLSLRKKRPSDESSD